MSAQENVTPRPKEITDSLLESRLDRRRLMRGVAGTGLAAGTAFALSERNALAQTPVVVPEITVTSYADLDAQIREAFQIEDAAFTEGTILWGESSDINTVNPIQASDSPTIPFLSAVFESLVGTNPVTGYAAAGLSESWEVADDGVTYTFRLNPNAKWHDGTPVTANDIKFSLDAILNPDTASSYGSSLLPVLKGYDEANPSHETVLDAYRAVDDQTFEVISNGPVSVFIERFGYYVLIMPRHVWESVPYANWATDPGSTGQDPSRVIGSGPFKFVSWTQGASAELVRNDDYYGNKAKVASVRFLPYENDDAEMNALKAGDLDITHSIPPTEVEILQNTEGFDVQVYDTWVFGWIGFQLDPAKSPLFQDVKVRQALMYGMDREAIVRDINLGFGAVADGTQPTLSPAYAPDKVRTKYTFDPEKSKQLLDEAGWAPGDDGIRAKDGQKLSFSANYVGGITTNEQQAAYLQDVWKDIGVEMTPNPIEYGLLVDQLTNTFDFQMVFLGFNWDITGDQTAMFGCNPRGGFNAMNYCNETFDQLSREARHEPDYDKYIAKIIEASNIVNDELPVMVISFRKDRDAFSTRVRNFYPNSYGGYLWWLTYGYGWVQE